MMADPLLEIRGLNKKFGDFQALKDIDLELDKGLMIALSARTDAANQR